MEFRPITELSSCKGCAYDGELIQCCIKIPRLDWDALKAYARDNGTSAGEIIRVLIRDFLAGVKTPSPRDSMDAGRWRA